MKRLPSLILMGLGVTLLACGKSPESQTPAPQANADSIAAAERARVDSAAADAARREQEEAERIARQRAADSSAAVAAAAAEVRSMLEAMVHFDFDKANIRGDDAATLDQKVAILNANPDLRIRINGHCDERGSDEYNLALGSRRASASKQYLVSHGVDASRIETASFGEERPMAMGQDEDSWAQNRRDEFEILSGGDMLHKP
jgi:peptidoglycan-associated lipoprotein